MKNIYDGEIFTWHDFTLTISELITIVALLGLTIFINRLLRYLVMKYGREKNWILADSILLYCLFHTSSGWQQF